jgi:hypothetical protein
MRAQLQEREIRAEPKWGQDCYCLDDRGTGVQHREERVVVRTALSTVAIFSVLFCPSLLAGLLALSRGHVRDGTLLCAAYVALVLWMASYRVELVPGLLVYRTLLTRREIDLSNVTASSVESRPAPTLVLRSGSRKLGEFIVKPFTREGVAAILEHVRASSPGVKLDRSAEAMRLGDFSVVTRQAIQAVNLLRIVLVVAGALLLAAFLRTWLR